MSDKRRITQHNGRQGANGVYSAKHGDRNFPAGNQEHIDESLSRENLYYTCYDKTVYRENDKRHSFEEVEKRFYEKNFSDFLEKRNDKQIKNRHADRVMTMDDYRTNARYCPEETIMQLGDRTKPLNRKTMNQLIMAQINWERQMFPQIKTLNIAFHFDEPNAADHVHWRKVWVAKDENGKKYVSQKDALKQMGIERPNPQKAESRYNNAKMTYSKMCREHFIELCQSYGLEIETEPKEKGKSGRDLDVFKAERAAEERAEAEKLRDQAIKEAEIAQEAAKQLQEAIGSLTGIELQHSNLKTDRNGYIKGGQITLKEYDQLLTRALIGYNITSKSNRADYREKETMEMQAKIIDNAKRRANSIVSDAILDGVKTKYQGREKEILWDMVKDATPALCQEAIRQCDLEMEMEALKIAESRSVDRGRSR